MKLYTHIRDVSGQKFAQSGQYTFMYMILLVVLLCSLANWPAIGENTTLDRYLPIANATDLAMVTAIAMVAALGCTVLILLSRLRILEAAHGIDSHAALHDELTGAANRRQFEFQLDKLLADANPSHTLLMIDLDRFKPINDLYGHAAGDALLKEITLGMKRLVQQNDVVARLGGDEFALLLSSRSSSAAEHTALDVLQFVSRYRLNWEGQRLSVGASIGLVSIDRPGLTSALLLAASDEALYAAKEAGRGAIFAADFSNDTNEKHRFRRVDQQAVEEVQSASSHIPEDGRKQQLLARLMVNLVKSEDTDRRRAYGARRRHEIRYWVNVEPSTLGDNITPGILMRELVTDASARQDGGADFARWVMAMALAAASRLNPVVLGRINFVLPMPARAFVVVPELADELMRSNALARLPIRHITFVLHGIASVSDSPLMQKMSQRFSASDIRLGFEIRSDNLEVLAPLKHIEFDELHLGAELIKKLRPASDDNPTLDALLAIVKNTDTTLVAACVDHQDEVMLLAKKGIKRLAGPVTGEAIPLHELLPTLK